jgi:hypothetical protein
MTHHIIMKKIIDRSGVSSNVVSFKNGKAMQALEKHRNSGQFQI